MRIRRFLAAPMLVIFGLSFLAWLLYDPTAVASTLGLDGLVDEAIVAVSGLAVGGAFCLAGAVLWRRRDLAA